MTEREVYSPAEVAEILNVHPETVRKWLVQGHLPGRKVRRINEVIAEYSKTVTHFMYLTKKNPHLIALLKSMSTLKALESESSDFNSISSINLLQDESEKESARLKAEYMKIGNVLDHIYEEMEKSISK